MARAARTGSPASDPPATRTLAAGRRPQPSRNRSGDRLDLTNGGAADVARKEPALPAAPTAALPSFSILPAARLAWPAACSAVLACRVAAAFFAAADLCAFV